MSRTDVLRDFMGAVIDEARLTRGTLSRLESKLDRVLSLLGERDAKTESLRADFDAVAKQVQGHERRLSGVGR